MNSDILFCLKEGVSTKQSRIALTDICSFYGADVSRLADISFDVRGAATAITAMDAAMRIKDVYKDAAVTNMGPAACTVSRQIPQKSRAFTIMKIVFLCAVMFFGGAVAIMTFHEDVSMKAVHSGIYAFFTGEQATHVPVVSIPYSIGVFVGLVLIFGIMRKRRKRPTVLDLDIYQREKEQKQYMAEKSMSGDG